MLGTLGMLGSSEGWAERSFLVWSLSTSGRTRFAGLSGCTLSLFLVQEALTYQLHTFR